MSYSTAPAPQQPDPSARRPGVFSFEISGKLLHADAARAFISLQDRVDEFNVLLADLQGGRVAATNTG